MNSPIPTKDFDGYSLMKCIGRGGMGEVYLAKDTLLDRHVAIKFIIGHKTDASARSRFMLEARAIARLQHPNVVSIYRVGEVEGYPYLVSEFIRGKDLESIDVPISSSQALTIAMGIARGLSAAHSRRVVHRDIKPANVILTEDGQPKLLDFGIAKLLETDEDKTPITYQHFSSGTTSSTSVVSISKTNIEAINDLGTTVYQEESGSLNIDTAIISSFEINLDLDTNTFDYDASHGSEGPVFKENDDAYLTKPGTIVGTPAYLAPEIWKGYPASFCSDVYSFGALLFRLCSGHAPHEADCITDLCKKIVEDQVQPMAEAAPQIDSQLAAIIDKCLNKDVSLRYASGNELRQAIAQLTQEVRDSIVPQGNPYRGLHTFEAEHQNLFFGRDSEIRLILERLKIESFVLVVGDSGVGKSSLCRAGVIPRINGWLEKNRKWSCVSLVPGSHPLVSLSSALAPYLNMTEAETSTAISEDPSGVGRQLRSQLGDKQGVLIFIDQLEELITLGNKEESEAVSELLHWLAVPGPQIKILATVRGDFLSKLAILPSIGDGISRALLFLRPMSEDRIRDAIASPAKTQGVSFESEDFINELVATTINEKGGLPLLQFALTELWGARNIEEKVITRKNLDAIGGVSGALTRHADNVMAQMVPEQRIVARRVLLNLVTSQNTRARKNDIQLETQLPIIRNVIDAMIRGRLLVARDTPEGAGYEIAHEALISGWSTLATWLSADAENRIALERLKAAAKEWERLERPGDSLWSWRQIKEVDEINESKLSQNERDFLKHSRAEFRKQRALRLGIIIGIPFIIIAIWGTLSLQSKIEITNKVNAKLSSAADTLKNARNIRIKCERIQRRAMILFDKPDLKAAELVWDKYLIEKKQLQPLYSRAAQLLETAYLLDRTRLDVKGMFADLLFERADLAKTEQRSSELNELLQRLVLYDDGGERLQKWKKNGKVSFFTTPKNATIDIAMYSLDENEKYRQKKIDQSVITGASLSLAQGSYIATFSAKGFASIKYPFVVEREDKVTIDIILPSEGAIPRGYVYIPPGKFYFGSAAENRQRRDFFHTAPIHKRSTKGYLIAEKETTFAQWLEYVETFPENERKSKFPRVEKGGFQGALVVSELPEGGYQIRFQPASQAYVAKSGEKIVYPERDRRKEQDWMAFPVFGISVSDAEQFVSWLRKSKKLKGARLCTELEWERGARGADEREFPHGERLDFDDANFDDTYSKIPLAMGPDEVGSHSNSISPFGLYDMAGNVWEWTRSTLETNGYVARGGSYYYGPNTSRSTERAVTEPSFRDTSVGLRICADYKIE